MLLKLKSVSVKNFMSFGNTKTIFNFEYGSTLIQASNGTGKTALFFDSIMYALTGSTIRSLNKKSITNFTNGSNCEVVLNIVINDNDIVIKRGISPDVFDVFIDDVEFFPDLTSSTKQKELNKLLNINKNILTQLMFIGSNNESFMSRTPASRREFVEKLLNLEVFSDLTQAARAELRELKTENTDINNKMETAKNELASLNDLLKTCKIPDHDYIEKLETFINANEPKLELLQEKQKNILDKINDLNDKLRTNGYDLNLEKSKLAEIKQNKCPTCGSELHADSKEIEKLETKIKQREKFANKTSLLVEELRVNREEYNNKIDKYTISLRDKKRSLDIEKSFSTDQADLIKHKIDNIESVLIDLNIASIDVTEKIEIFTIIESSLRKGEAKSAIVSNFIPFFNSRINDYLSAVDLAIKFEFDSEFNESFKSRYKDNASYHNFSTGEQSLIDTAILLTWRDVASKIGSVVIDTLIFDEFGNVLDDEKLRANIDLVTSQANMKFIALTPKLVQSTMFDRTHTLHKEQNFSILN